MVGETTSSGSSFAGEPPKIDNDKVWCLRHRGRALVDAEVLHVGVQVSCDAAEGGACLDGLFLGC